MCVVVLGALYVKAAFGETDRLKANEIIKNIRENFQENLNKLQWIDEQSKSEARKKLEKIYEKIGYPDYITNQTKLDERFVLVFRRKKERTKIFISII